MVEYVGGLMDCSLEMVAWLLASCVSGLPGGWVECYHCLLEIG